MGQNKPLVLPIPAGAGTNGQLGVQVPTYENSLLSLLNLGTIGLMVSPDDTFPSTTTFPLAGGGQIPVPGVDNLWIQNPNGTAGQVLVLYYDLGYSLPSVPLSSGGL